MGNSALKSHLETSQKTGVFQLTGKGLQEVRHTSSSHGIIVFIVKYCRDVHCDTVLDRIMCCFHQKRVSQRFRGSCTVQGGGGFKD